MKLFILFVLTGISLSVMSQDYTLWMRNGKRVQVKDYKVLGDNYYDGEIQFTTIKGKSKTKYLDDYFAVVDNAGKETVFYVPDENLGEILSVDGMKQYVLGRHDALTAKVSPLIFIGGIATGFGGAVIPKPTISMGGSDMVLPIGVLVPATYIAIMGATPPTADKLSEQMPDKASNEDYLLGYQSGVKKKRIRNSILGSCVGLIAGFVVIAVVD